MNNDVILGIDLGTIDSCAAIFRNGAVETVPDTDGHKIIASMVCYKEDNDLFLYGETARDNSLEFAKTTMFESKRFIGNKKFKFKEVQNDIDHLPVKIIEDKATGKPKYQIKQKEGIKEYFPEDVSSMILEYIKNYCEVFKGYKSKIKKTIITVPAHFNKWEREATLKAGTDAGLTNIGLLNEATAAAIAYGDKFKSDKKMKILIFDIGGGTFDVSILSVKGKTYKVLSSCGDSHLGGEDFNQLLFDYVIKEAQKDKVFKDVDFTKPRTLKRLRKEVEKKKRELSKIEEASFFIEALKGDKDFKLIIKRKKYEELCMKLWNRMFDVVKRALKIAKIDKNELDNVIFVGGPTRTPKIEEMAKNFFGTIEILKTVNVEEVVAQGAALSGNQDLIIEDTISKSIGIEIGNETMNEIIPQGMNLPIAGKTYVCAKKYTLKKGNKAKQKIKIFEGNSQNIKENDYIGEFTITLDEDEKDILIQMKIDHNLILHVTAVVNGKKKENMNIEMKTITE